MGVEGLLPPPSGGSAEDARIEPWSSGVEDGVMRNVNGPATNVTSARDFTDFYKAELDGQVRRAGLLLGSADQANDVVHDAFTEVFRRWEQLDEPGPYLNRAVLNRCRDVARSRARRVRVSHRLVRTDTTWNEEPIADLLDGLPFNQRAAVVLKFYVGLSNLEIAESLGCPPGSVGPWLNRALTHIRKAMQ